MRSGVLSLSFVLSLLLTFPALAQRSGGGAGLPGGSIPQSATSPRGAEMMTVRVTTEQDRPISFDVRVQLTNNAGVPISETFAHDGMAQLSVQPGNYRLRVTAPQIEDAVTDSFTVFGSEGAPMQFVRVKLRQSNAPAGSMEGTVSAYELNIPAKARAEGRKGQDEMARQQWKKAMAHLEKAIEIYPQYAGAYNDLGVACLKSGDNARARQSFQKAVDLNEHTGAAYLNLARFSLMEKNYPETIRLSNRALALNPQQPEALLFLADSEFATGQYAAAIVHARKIHELPHQRFAVAHIIAASALEAQQKPADAVAEYETFLKEDPNSPRAAAVRQALTRLAAQAQPNAVTPKP